MSNPARYSFTLVLGDSFSDVWTVKDSAGTAIDLSGGTARMEINTAADGSGTALLVATSSDWIALGADGTMTFSVPAASTTALSFTTAYYDAWITLSGTKETILYGEVTGQKAIS